MDLMDLNMDMLNIFLGVHTAARKGVALALKEHLGYLRTPMSLLQKVKFQRMQRSRDLLRKYRRSKVCQTIVLGNISYDD